MKLKYLVWIIVMITLISCVSAATPFHSSTCGTGADNGWGWIGGNEYDNFQIVNTTGGTQNLGNITFEVLVDSGAQTGDYWLEVQDESGGKPGGSIIDNGTSLRIYGQTITPVPQNVTWYFENTTSLPPGVHAIVMMSNDTNSAIRLRITSAGSCYAGGQAGYRLDGGAWQAQANVDYTFWMYNKTSVPVSPTTNFTVTAFDKFTGVQISTFNATINGTTYGTTSYELNTSILNANGGLFNLTVFGEDYDNLSTVVNVSNNYRANLTYYFYSSTQFDNPVFEKSTTDINLTLNITDSVINTTAEIIYNGTVFAATEVPLANRTIWTVEVTTPAVVTPETILFTWNYTIGRTNNLTRATLTANHSVEPIGIDNCSTFTIPSLNFTLRNETNLVKLDGNLEGYFTIFLTDVSNSKSFNITWQNPNSTFPICINNASATYLTNAQMEYSATGFSTKTYYLNNASLSSTFQSIDLYLTDGTTQVTFFVTDENDDPVPNAFISILSYDLPTDSYKTTEIIKTDSDGEAFANVILNTQFYKFIINLNNEIVLESEPTYVGAEGKSFRLNLVLDYLNAYTVVQGTACDLTFTNATRNFNYVFNDPTGGVVEGCLEVIRRSINGDSDFNTSCVSSSSGNILINIGTNMSGAYTYVATGRITVGGLSFACGDPKSRSDNVGWRAFGKEGMWVSFMIISSLSMIGLFNPIAAIVFALIGLIGVNIFGLFHLSTPILWGFIIIGGLAIFRSAQK